MTSALSSLQRRLAGIALIAFVALLYAQHAIDPTDGVENAERIAMAAENSGRLFAATALLFLSSVFMLARGCCLVRQRHAPEDPARRVGISAAWHTLTRRRQQSVVQHDPFLIVRPEHKPSREIAICRHFSRTSLGHVWATAHRPAPR
jgi:hypothetical protein